MRSLPALFVLSTAFGALLTGCGQPVREDRTVHWAADGSAVGFQHGPEGVFIRGKDGKLRKIFQPDENTLATSTPLWSPGADRVLFTTAEPLTAGQATNQPPPEPDPAGQVHFEQPVRYTCWLWSEKDGPDAKPVRLFTARCDHVGLVAANRAVRWHPRGDQVLYVDESPGGGQGLFSFDLKTQAVRWSFPHTAEALVFDWSPDHTHLACVLGHKAKDPQRDGIWIGKPDGGAWWHVPHSDDLAQGRLPSVLECLRATGPFWTADGKRFAFVSSIPGQSPNEAGRHFLWLGTLTAERVEALADGPEAFRDLHWTPDGTRLGVVCEGKVRSLRTLRPGEALSAPINRRPVRRFAGWDSKGGRLAYVVPEDRPVPEGERWAFLFMPERQPRDVLLLADGSGKEPGQAVFSGMRVTFSAWSPREPKLSAWFTFSPTYRSAFGWLLNWSQTVGLRRGDPAVVVDAQTGAVSWLAVDGYEKAQVGNYYQLKRDYAQAWHWYEEAEREPAAARPHGSALAEILSPRDATFFEYHCLTRLDRNAEAQAKLVQFRSDFEKRLAAWRQTRPTVEGPFEQQLRELADPKNVLTPLFRDLYAAEVFLSLDAVEDGENHFRSSLASATDDRERLSSALALAQLLLLDQKYQAYADLVTDTVLPLLLKLWPPQKPGAPRNLNGPQSGLISVAGLTLLPLYAPEFLACLPDGQLTALTPRWQALREQATDDTTRLGLDLFLAAAAQRLGRDAEQREAERRIEANPVRSEVIPQGVAGLIKQVRETPTQMEAFRQLLAPSE